MDKVKAQAEQAAAKAQEGLATGQGKINDLQAKRSADKMLRDLGAAVYAHQRDSGSADTVNALLAQLDGWVAEHGKLDTSLSTPVDPPAADTAAAAMSGDVATAATAAEPADAPMPSHAAPPPPPPAPSADAATTEPPMAESSTPESSTTGSDEVEESWATPDAGTDADEQPGWDWSSEGHHSTDEPRD